MTFLTSMRGRAGSWLFAIFVLLPGSLYLALPVVFVSTVVTLFFTLAIHPLVGLAIPVAEGLMVGLGYNLRGAKKPSQRTRWLLLALAAAMSVLLLLIVKSFAGCEVACTDNDRGRWFFLGPVLAVLTTSLLASVTGSRRALVTSLAITAAILANGGILVAWIALWLFA